MINTMNLRVEKVGSKITLIVQSPEFPNVGDPEMSVELTPEQLDDLEDLVGWESN